MRHFSFVTAALCALAIGCVNTPASAAPPAADPQAPVNVSKLVDQPDEWFRTDEGRRIVDNIVTWQNGNGGWWKQYDARQRRPAKPAPGETPKGPPADAGNVWQNTSTFDNGATYSELRILARAHRVLGDAKYKDAFDRGLKFVFDAQYPNGGWPQRFPLEKNYGRHITFNDNAMTSVMSLLSDIAAGKPDFALVSGDNRKRAKDAFDRGVECILKCQIKVNGKLTVWCQQHDAETLAPTNARAYELPSLCSAESADILMLLMRLEQPDARVRDAIESAVAWFDRSTITGKRWETVTGPQYEGGRDKVLVDDPSAPPLWARFYDIETNKPFFVGRDGVPRDSVDQISAERRWGYAWYNTQGAKVAQAYIGWKQRVGAGESAAAAAAIPAAGAIVVAADGSGSFTTVQAAVDSIPANNAERVVIRIKPGTYKQRVHLAKDKPRVTFRGDDAKTTVLTFDLHAKSTLPPATQPVGTSGSYSTLIEGDDFIAENITFENTAGEVGQAVALRTTGERQSFFNCRMLGWQDTLYVHQGSAYFKDCYVEGRVDFIFGRATTVFDKCHVHSKNGGYVTAAATAKDDPFGFVFLDCKLSGEGDKAFLGRPWRDDAAVAFIRCELGDHVRPEGWDNWRNPAREKTARFAEYKCIGPGADRSKRVPWSRELSDEEAATYTVSNILKWEPAKP